MNSYFKLARNVSKHSDYKIKMGAVIVRKGKPLSVGFNKDKTHPQYEFSIHAEMDAIRTSGRRSLKNGSIYVYRERADGTPAIARPCEDCMSVLRDYGIKYVYYTTDYPPFWNKEILE